MNTMKGSSVLNPRPKYIGFTLVELLVVLVITMVLAGIVLPVVKESIRDRRSTSAAVQVRAFFDAARIRAIAKNREIAVVIERARVNIPGPPSAIQYEDRFRNAGVKLSMAEVLPPYRGDFDGATVVPIAADSSFTTFAISTIENPNAIVMISKGDSISFADRRRRFLITAVSVVGSELRFVIANPGDLSTIPLSLTKPVQVNNFESQMLFSSNPISFQVYGKPRRLFYKAISLPSRCVLTYRLAE